MDAPAGAGTRPTSDRVRESIFNILGQRFAGGRVLDLYAGSGALGLEALSRGGERAVFVEQDSEAVRICRKNVETLGYGDRAEVIRGEVVRALRSLAARGEDFDWIFADPPYEVGPGAALALIDSLSLLAPGGRIVAEHPWRSPPEAEIGGLVRTDLRRFGEPAASFYERRTSEPQ